MTRGEWRHSIRCSIVLSRDERGDLLSGCVDGHVEVSAVNLGLCVHVGVSWHGCADRCDVDHMGSLCGRNARVVALLGGRGTRIVQFAHLRARALSTAVDVCIAPTMPVQTETLPYIVFARIAV